MNQNHHDVCFKLAKKIRKKIDKAVKDRSKWFDLFYEDLMGVCAIASMSLKKSLAKRKIPAEVYCGKFVENENDDLYHCWIVLDGKSYDLTATQFKGIRRKVYVLNTNNRAYKNKYKIGERVTSLKFFQDWPNEQKPTSKVTKHLMV